MVAHPTARAPFRRLRGGDVRAILIGTGALFVVRIGTAFQLVATHQTNHVQSGFEHFDVVGKAPDITVLSIALAALAMVVVAPVAEELLFRGLLFGALAPRIGVLAAALVSAVLFGAAHGDPILFPTLAALGFVSAIAYAATGNLWVSVTLHALNNAVGVDLPHRSIAATRVGTSPVVPRQVQHDTTTCVNAPWIRAAHYCATLRQAQGDNDTSSAPRR